MNCTLITLVATFAVPGSGATVSPEAAPVLDRMLDWYASLSGASTVVEQTVHLSGMPPMTSGTSVSVLKPNRFLIKPVTQEGGMSMPQPIVVSNGSRVIEALPEITSWSTAKAPASLDVDDLKTMQLIGPAGFVFDLLAKDAKEQILSEFKSVTLAGSTEDSDLLQFIGEESGMEIPITLSISKGASAWMTQLKITIPPNLGGGMPAEGMPPELAYEFRDWRVLEQDDENIAIFSWEPPKEWTKVDDVLATAMGPAAGPDDGGPESMTGKPAPAFTLTSLDGQEISLESLRGQTVILDFWATWCRPCLQGLPVLMEVAKAHAEDGVVLWSVDLDETAEKVRSFIDRQKWNLPVLLDTRGRVARKYGVGGIPHTVVIDPEGIIRLVEVGFPGKQVVKQKIGQVIGEIKKRSAVPTGS